MAYVCAACTVCATIFSIGGKFQLVSNVTELHALTSAARSCALLDSYLQCKFCIFEQLYLLTFNPRRQKLDEVEKHETLPPHPNCVQFHQAWEERQHLYIQTELCQMRWGLVPRPSTFGSLSLLNHLQYTEMEGVSRLSSSFLKLGVKEGGGKPG